MRPNYRATLAHIHTCRQCCKVMDLVAGYGCPHCGRDQRMPAPQPPSLVIPWLVGAWVALAGAVALWAILA